MATKAGKKTPGFIPLADWGEADQALAAIATLSRQVAQHEGEFNRKTQPLRERFEAETAPLLAEKAEWEKRLEAFTRERKEEMGPKKSRQLTFGLVKLYLTPPAVVFKKSKKWTLYLLQQLGLRDYIRTKEEPDVEAMHRMSDEALAKVAARRKQTEEFSYELADIEAQAKPDAGAA